MAEHLTSKNSQDCLQVNSIKSCFVIFLLLAPLACDDGYPPCAPEGNGPGTIYGPTPSPLPGPGGPNDPPDWADEPPKYSKNEEGEVCTCGPYQPGCTTDPDGVPGDEFGEIAADPNLCDPDCSSNDSNSSTPDQQAGGFSPAAFKFVTIVADDGTGEAGGWQAASATLRIARLTSFTPEIWACSVIVGMPLRTALHGTIFPDTAASISAAIATQASANVKNGAPDLPKGIFCTRLGPEMQRLFKEKYPYIGATVN